MKHSFIKIYATLLIGFILQACAQQKGFQAPVIYSLQANSNAKTTNNDSSKHVAATEKVIVRDTVHYIRDSIRIINDTVHYIIQERVPYKNRDTARTYSRPTMILKNKASRDTIKKVNTPVNDIYQQRVDSLQKRLDKLLYNDTVKTSAIMPVQQLRSVTTDTIIDTVSEGYVARQDSLSASLRMTQVQLKENEEKLKRMNENLQRSKDSASYYQRLAFATGNSMDTVEVKKKWHQTIFKSNKQKKQEESQAQNAIQNREGYYDTEINRMNQEISALKTRNSNLSENYSKLQTDLNNTRVVTTPERIVYTERGTRDNSNNTAQLLLLQNELNALRNQRNNVTTSTISRIDTVYLKPSAPQPLDTTEQADTVALMLQSELAALRNEIQALKKAQTSVPVQTVTQPVAETPTFNARSFPLISVYFVTGSSKPGTDQLSKIQPFAEMAKQDIEATIVLKGFTDAVGNMDANKALANKRSASVKELLVSDYNISINRIIIEAPVVQNSKSRKADPLARRVDLQFR